jgi:hypothetical protein
MHFCTRIYIVIKKYKILCIYIKDKSVYFFNQRIYIFIIKFSQQCIINKFYRKNMFAIS